MVRRIAVALAAVLVAAVVLGSASRMMMAFVSVSAGHPSQFSWSGSVGIVLIYAMFMLPGALLAAFLRRRGRWVLLAVGAIGLVLPAVGVAGEELGATAGFSVSSWVLVSLSGLGVFATIALLPVATLRLLDRGLARSSRPGVPAGRSRAALVPPVPGERG